VARLDPLRLAFGTLTAVPVPPPTSTAAPVPGRAMALAPLAGLVPGAGAGIAAGIALQFSLGATVAAVAAVGMYALATRGLHLDGLGDTADGLAVSYRRERALEVMRLGNVGPAGLAAVVIVLLLQVAGLTDVLMAPVLRAYLQHGDWGRLGTVILIVGVVAVAARVAIPVACAAGIPPARPEGLGATVAGTVAAPTLAAVLVLTAAACGLGTRLAGLTWWSGPLAVLLVAAATGLLVRRATTRFGGITGDVLGAAVEIGAAVAVLTLAAAG
jgi:adenosylcobinamide-GDP ribazoletransferase